MKDGWCIQHTPNLSAEMKRAMRSAGGKARQLDRLVPARLRGVFEEVVQGMRDLKDGTLSATKATALASLATAAVRVLEAGEMEERLRQIERATAEDEDPAPGALSESETA